MEILKQVHMEEMPNAPRFLHLWAHNESSVTGLPHLVAINVTDIVAVEEVNRQTAVSDDEIAWVPGSCITIRDAVAQADVAQSFDTVMALMKFTTHGPGALQEDEMVLVALHMQNLGEQILKRKKVASNDSE